jgi:hypothetical protein
MGQPRWMREGGHRGGRLPQRHAAEPPDLSGAGLHPIPQAQSYVPPTERHREPLPDGFRDALQVSLDPLLGQLLGRSFGAGSESE